MPIIVSRPRLVWTNPEPGEWDIGWDISDPDGREKLVMIAIAEPDPGLRRSACFTLATEVWNRLAEPRGYRVALAMTRAGMRPGSGPAALVRLFERGGQAFAALSNDPLDLAGAVSNVLGGEGELLPYAPGYCRTPRRRSASRRSRPSRRHRRRRARK